MAPGGFDTWEAYDAANDPGYYDDWGTPPGGYVTWIDFTIEVEAGIVPIDVAEEYLPEEVQEAYIPEPPPVYVPTISYTSIDTSVSQVLSWATVNDLTSQLVTATSSSVLDLASDDYWYTTETTVTTTDNSYVDTTTEIAQDGVSNQFCAYSDGNLISCQQTVTWEPSETTVTVGDTTSTSTVVTTVADPVPQSCSQGGFTGLGDWCIIESNHRSNDMTAVAFSVPTAAEENEACDCTDGDGLMDIRIDAETNMTQAAFNSGPYGDPYIFLNHDTDSDDGEHSGDTSEITVGGSIESDDDGGRDCGNTCNNPPSSAEDVDETPNVTLSNGDPVIDNVSDSWDSRIERELSTGDYVLRGSVYNQNNDGWFRLTIRDADVEYP
jgi:hypothetical protein